MLLYTHYVLKGIGFTDVQLIQWPPGVPVDILAPNAVFWFGKSAICRATWGVFSAQIQHLVTAGWLKLSYSTITMHRVNGWVRVAQSLRKQTLNESKPATNELVESLGVAV